MTDGRETSRQDEQKGAEKAPEPLREALADAVLLFACLCRDCTALDWLDRARAALASTAPSAELPQCVLGLIAVLNRDGGHCRDEHGLEAACQRGVDRYIEVVTALDAAEYKLANRTAPSAEAEPARDYCPEKLKPGGCQLHNLHCGFPDCNRAPAEAGRAFSVGWGAGLGMYRAELLNLCHLIEAIPASPKQTAASVAASNLHQSAAEAGSAPLPKAGLRAAVEALHRIGDGDFSYDNGHENGRFLRRDDVLRLIDEGYDRYDLGWEHGVRFADESLTGKDIGLEAGSAPLVLPEPADLLELRIAYEGKVIRQWITPYALANAVDAPAMVGAVAAGAYKALATPLSPKQESR